MAWPVVVALLGGRRLIRWVWKKKKRVGDQEEARI